MRIKNEGKRTFCFNGGSIAPREVVDLKDEAIAKALLKCYPNELISLDELKARVVEAPDRVIEEVKEEKKEEVVEDVAVEEPAETVTPKRKASKKKSK